MSLDPSILFTDTFANGSTAGWRAGPAATEVGWGGSPGLLTAATPSGDRPTIDAVLTAGRDEWADCSVSVRVRPEGTGDLGIMVRRSATGDGYRFTMGSAADPPLRLESVRGGEPQVLAANPAWGSYTAGHWYEVVVRIVGAAIAVEIDGAAVLDATVPTGAGDADDHELASGHIALWSGSDRVSFTDVEVRVASSRFTLVVLPDTQEYLTHGRGDHFAAQTRWIAANRAGADVVAVLHVGDIVDSAECAEQWDFASMAMANLDGKLPVVMTTGNHDVVRYVHENPPHPCTEAVDPVPHGYFGSRMFARYFPADRYRSLGTFEGTDDDTFRDTLGADGASAYFAGSVDNSFQIVRAAGLDLLLLALTFGPSDEALEWANRVVAAHPDHLVVLVTHDFLGDDNEVRGSRVSPPAPREEALPGAATPIPGHGNHGQNIWDAFVSRHANIRLIVSGHVTEAAPGRSSRDFLAGRRILTRDDGSQVLALFANYQTRADGGGGYLRLLELDVIDDRLSVTTITPTPSMEPKKRRPPALTDPENAFVVGGILAGSMREITTLRAAP